MPPFQILIAIAMPVLMVAGAIAALRSAKKDDLPKPPEQTWQDDSLTQWRLERDAAATAEREARVDEATTRALSGGKAEEGESPVRHQRIGG